MDVIGFGDVDLEGIQYIHPHKSKLQAIELQVGTHVYECRYVYRVLSYWGAQFEDAPTRKSYNYQTQLLWLWIAFFFITLQIIRHAKKTLGILNIGGQENT